MTVLPWKWNKRDDDESVFIAVKILGEIIVANELVSLCRELCADRERVTPSMLCTGSIRAGCFT